MSPTPSSGWVFTVTKAYLIPTDAMSAATCVYGVSTWHLNGTNVSWRDLNILKTFRLYVLELKYYFLPSSPPTVNHFIRSYALAEVYYYYMENFWKSVCLLKLSIYRVISQACSPPLFFFFNNVVNHNIWKPYLKNLEIFCTILKEWDASFCFSNENPIFNCKHHSVDHFSEKYINQNQNSNQ